LAENNRLHVDFFRINDDGVKAIKNLDVWLNSEPVLFGYNTTLNQLKQWQRAKPNSADYDAVLLLTDKGNYESKEKSSIDIDNKTPLWIVHLGDEPASAYADQLLDYIYQSGGGIGDKLENVLIKMLYKQQRATDQLSEISDHYLWHFRKIKPLDSFSPESRELAPIIARQWIGADFNRFNAAHTKVLDELHHMAKKHSLVSPFSSMIVLVNQHQKEQLKKLSKDKERYKREVETGKKQIPVGSDLLSSVPEPEEWVLMIIALIVLTVARLKKWYLTQKPSTQWRCS
jgi:putative PEP-CTERM system integral membrane protein